MDLQARIEGLSADRQRAIALMRKLGWSVYFGDGGKKRWTFRRPDGSGLFDVSHVAHGQLSMTWALRRCLANEPELISRVRPVMEAWADEIMG